MEEGKNSILRPLPPPPPSRSFILFLSLPPLLLPSPAKFLLPLLPFSHFLFSSQSPPHGLLFPQSLFFCSRPPPPSPPYKRPHYCRVSSFGPAKEKRRRRRGFQNGTPRGRRRRNKLFEIYYYCYWKRVDCIFSFYSAPGIAWRLHIFLLSPTQFLCPNSHTDLASSGGA